LIKLPYIIKTIQIINFHVMILLFQINLHIPKVKDILYYNQLANLFF